VLEGPVIRCSADRVERALAGRKATRVHFAFPRRRHPTRKAMPRPMRAPVEGSGIGVKVSDTKPEAVALVVDAGYVWITAL